MVAFSASASSLSRTMLPEPPIVALSAGCERGGVDAARSSQRQRIDGLGVDDDVELAEAHVGAPVGPPDLEHAVGDLGLDQRKNVVVAGDRESLARALADLDVRPYTERDAVKAGRRARFRFRCSGTDDGGRNDGSGQGAEEHELQQA
jgi:hypothetical protein